LIKTTVHLPSELIAALDEMAEREGGSRSAFVRDALDWDIRQRSRPMPAWIGLIDEDDESLTASNVGDWLRVNR